MVVLTDDLFAAITGTNAALEEWRLIPVTDGYYSVSNLGRVRSEPINAKRVGRQRGRILSPCPDTKGYLFFRAIIPGGRSRNIKVHRAVAAAFIGAARDGMQVNHRDGDKLNNAVGNLEYMTCRENIHHCWRNGLHGVEHCRGAANCCAKLTEDDVRVIRQLHPSMCLSQLAGLYGISKTTVSSIVRRRTWRHV